MAKRERAFFTEKELTGEKYRPKAKPYKVAEHAEKGAGRLVLRVLPSGVKEFFYRYRAGGADKLVSLGRYDPKGKNGRTLAEIRNAPKVGLASVRATQRDTGDVKAHRQAEAERREAEKRAREIERRRGTFGQLLDAYVDAMQAAGKPSAVDVRRIFRRYVAVGTPDLLDRKANEIAPGDVQRILARMVKAGITRQVNVTRSYLRAAFTYGGRADHDPRTVAADGVLFGLRDNPVNMIPRIQEYERAGERVLSLEELRAFWIACDTLPSPQCATLRLNLALACQRPTQLLRAEWSDIDSGAGTLLLRDTKGRGGSRDHLLPLTAFALDQLQPLLPLRDTGAPPFSSDGKRRIVLTTLSAAVREISRALTKADKIPPFQMRDLRRTAETMLQQLGVDREVRAHLLSHGRTTGVQGQHYERYDFLPEKRAALEKWADHLRRIIDPSRKATVVEIAKRRTRPA